MSIKNIYVVMIILTFLVTISSTFLVSRLFNIYYESLKTECLELKQFGKEVKFMEDTKNCYVLENDGWVKQ